MDDGLARDRVESLVVFAGETEALAEVTHHIVHVFLRQVVLRVVGLPVQRVVCHLINCFILFSF